MIEREKSETLVPGGASLPTWVVTAANQMCDEGAGLYLGWYFWKDNLLRFQRNYQAQYEEAKYEARQSFLHHKEHCPICSPPLRQASTTFGRLIGSINHLSALAMNLRNLADRRVRR